MPCPCGRGKDRAEQLRHRVEQVEHFPAIFNVRNGDERSRIAALGAIRTSLIGGGEGESHFFYLKNPYMDFINGMSEDVNAFRKQVNRFREVLNSVCKDRNSLRKQVNRLCEPVNPFREPVNAFIEDVNAVSEWLDGGIGSVSPVCESKNSPDGMETRRKGGKRLFLQPDGENVLRVEVFPDGPNLPVGDFHQEMIPLIVDATVFQLAVRLGLDRHKVALGDHPVDGEPQPVDQLMVHAVKEASDAFLVERTGGGKQFGFAGNPPRRVIGQAVERALDVVRVEAGDEGFGESFVFGEGHGYL